MAPRGWRRRKRQTHVRLQANMERFLELAHAPKVADLGALLTAARAVLPPMAPCWRALARACALEWDTHLYTYINGNGILSYADVLDGRYDLAFAWRHRCEGAHEDRRWYESRYAAVLFALHAMFPSDVRARNLRALAARLYVPLDVELSQCIRADGLENQSWRDVQALAASWLRVWTAARRIQRAFRDMRERRMRARCLLWVPRLVALLATKAAITK